MKRALLSLCLLLSGSLCAPAQHLPAVGVQESVTLTATSAQALAAAAVLQIPSHGISGTVIWTSQGRTLILSCAHGHQGADRAKPMAFNVPTTGAGQPKPVKSRVLAIGRVENDDLTLIEFGDGPLPYVCPVAPRNHQTSKTTLSVGYDDMRWPSTQRQALILASMTETRERPWHGRSGGALIDQDGSLVGVCSGYTGPHSRQEVVPGGRGLYVSHQTICSFLDRAGYSWLVGSVPSPGSPVPPGAPSPVPGVSPGGSSDLRGQVDALAQQLVLIQQQLAVIQRGLQAQGCPGGCPAPGGCPLPGCPDCPGGKCPPLPRQAAPPAYRQPPSCPPGGR